MCSRAISSSAAASWRAAASELIPVVSGTLSGMGAVKKKYARTIAAGMRMTAGKTIQIQIQALLHHRLLTEESATGGECGGIIPE
ncbi:hypothetical protein ADL26_15105 [Thermoactinomyces vulgaris]|nr:hypothetical protein ADL26_15105 [Thermoactinomyces vulgaris]